MLTSDEQEQIRAWVRTHCPGDPPDKIRLSEIHIAAYRVIGLTLGVEWCDRMVKPSVTAPAHDFLRRGIASRDESLMHVDRVIYLAEYLTRLSTVPNFDEKVKDLRNYGLEETFYELRVARSLQKRDRLIKFVVPSSVRGQDFDLEARLDTEPLALEVKCLTDEPDYEQPMGVMKLSAFRTMR